ncbi:MAG: PAS domain-containing protein [Hymenobacteraceae bacterium]|nr:PAS domain-containing protein [Hymenobacteraceae bacterium]
MVTHSPDVFGCVDREGKILYVNQACEDMTGYSSAELTGRNYLDFVHAEDHALTLSAVEEAFESRRKVSFENRFYHRDGQVVY